ncbi:hypothetical protein [Roseiconus lacunae]|uniref:Uncharacterized protein n=1 Tax=Roseiconus lacunae TaxID=2605694 RepID=A0ABT7PF78_9BACT|nr:hypothetical protein [Roseiconus lacunae]MDM4014891.1 hypothetical protein [Roseiconus lacunae]
MTNSQRLATVRAHLCQWIQSTYAIGIDTEDLASGIGILSESILIREGYYVGRNFKIGTGDGEIRATWFMEPDEIKVRRLDGEIIVVFSSDEILGEQATPIEATTQVGATDDVSEEESRDEFDVAAHEESADDVAKDDAEREIAVTADVKQAELADTEVEGEVASESEEAPATIPITTRDAGVAEGEAAAEGSQSERADQSAQDGDAEHDNDVSKAA